MAALTSTERQRRAMGRCICGCDELLPTRLRYSGSQEGWVPSVDPRALYASGACKSRVARWRRSQGSREARSLPVQAKERPVVSEAQLSLPITAGPASSCDV